VWQVLVILATMSRTRTESRREFLGAQTQEVQLSGLSEPEIDRVLDAFPALAAVAREPRARRLLERPYVADLLARALPASGTGEFR